MWLSTEQKRSLGLLTAILFLSHGLLIGQLGFNWDDWFWLLVGRLQGLSGFFESTSIDRPLMGLYTAASYTFLGLRPLGWHLLVWVGRWLAVILFWWGLRGLWPHRRLETTMIALLFAVYPGYLQHPLPVCSTQQYIALILSLFSLGAMVWARRIKQRGGIFLDLAALLVIPFYALLFEYYAGLDLLRPLILWQLSDLKAERSRKNRLGWVVRRWMPYLVVLLAVVGYRLFIFKPNLNLGVTYWATDVSAVGAYYRGALKKDFLGTLVKLVIGELRSIFEALVIGWGPLLEVLRVNVDDRSSWAAWGLLGLSSGLVMLSLRLMQGKNAEPSLREDSIEERRWVKGLLLGGLFAVSSALLVSVLVRLQKAPPTAESQMSRYLLPASMGVSLCLWGLGRSLLKSTSRNLVFSLFIGLSVAANFLIGWTYKREWEIQRSFWWQLAWRAPQIKPGTTLFVDIPPNPLKRGRRSTYEIYAPANLIYQHGGDQPSLWGFDLHSPKNVQLLRRGGRYADQTRSLKFEGDLRNALVLHLEKKWMTGLCEPCLKIMKPDEPIPDNFELPLIAEITAPYSNIDRVDVSAQPSVPQGGVLGQEPPHRWCYFYQKMELFRQRGDWAEVLRLAKEAESRGLRPEEPTEGLAAIEGYLRMGEVEKGKQLLAKLLERSPDDYPSAHQMMGRLKPQQDLKRFVDSLKRE